MKIMYILDLSGSYRHFLLRRSIVGSIQTWDNTCDPQFIVLSLGVIRVRLMYVCKVARDTGFIRNAEWSS